jgi:hypothetical protein
MTTNKKNFYQKLGKQLSGRALKAGILSSNLKIFQLFFAGFRPNLFF